MAEKMRGKKEQVKADDKRELLNPEKPDLWN